MSESSFARALRDGFRKKAKELGHKTAWTRLECSGEGIPDVVISLGGNHYFIELKYVANYPKKDITPVRIPHFTSAQRWWSVLHGEAGWLCYVFIKIQNDFILFHWSALEGLGSWTKEQMKERAIWHCSGRLDYEGFVIIMLEQGNAKPEIN